MSLKQMLKRLSIFLMMFALFAITSISNPALAVTPQGLYDRAWRLINAKYVDDTQINKTGIVGTINTTQ